MNTTGIHTAFQGRIGQDSELKFLQNGNPMLSFSVAVETGAKAPEGQYAPSEWVKVVLFGEAAEELLPRCAKGEQVYCEGRLTVNRWTDRDGKERAGLSVVASLIQPLHQIGRKAPQQQGTQRRSPQRQQYGGTPALYAGSGVPAG